MRSLGAPERSTEAGPLLPNKKTCVERFPVLDTIEGPQYLPIAALRNLRAAVTGALVSISLSIALGIASGTTPGAGLSAAIWGALSCGLVGSSQFNNIGPAGALTGLLTGYTHRWGPGMLPWMSLCVAGVVFMVQLLGLHTYLLFFPNSVIEGFNVAVAMLIALGQLNNGFGLLPAHSHAEFIDNFVESLKVFDQARSESYVLFLIEAVILYALCRYVPKIPWMTLLPMSTILLGYFSEDLGWALPTLRLKYGSLSVGDVFRLPDTAGWSVPSDDLGSFAMAVASVSAIAVLEGLISAKIGETRTGYTFDSLKETRAVSLTHLACGVFGGIPCAGVFIRTSISVDCGATHRLAQFMNGLIVAATTLVAMPVFEHLPLPSIAAVLWVASIRMVPMGNLIHLFHVDKMGFCLCILTAVLSVVIDPVVGLVVGMVIALLQNAMKVHSSPRTVERQGTSSTIIIRGPITFVNADEVKLNALNVAACTCTMSAVYVSTFNLDESTAITLDLQHVTEIDADGAEMLRVLVLQLPSNALVRLTAEVMVTHAEFLPQMSLKWFNRMRRIDARAIH